MEESITCGPNEVVDECPTNCSAEYCPTSEDRSPCPQPDKNSCPPAKCVCGFNYRRAENGTCIPTTSCPPFECSRENEEYNPCPFLCPTDSCADAPLHGVCPYPVLIRLPCNPTCQCKEGFCRQDGTCIPTV
ncbi:late cornified envelope-like proline-rich protein 1 isoform X2 [Aricia agestis]|uniref:late cornified envelope-like proline-rich protein 1 isoform X2 n=1 Tax=Aricia agestis TaxID=91739 RepID=UPI001C207130|nr:late cornified envelope-like proline-rich protein 1 isoform X2 [Aricia agestis]